MCIRDRDLTLVDAAYGTPSMQAFSRFYFVGDEDLLEIVGNANEPAKVAQHLGKMFASVAALNMPTGTNLHSTI